ncbi:fimbrial isopeptide formation D2 domain [Listeria grayi]|uniref:Fimbrial isopeptide formation D2 domain n=1 Tax=Listeria grayi TaxID=1641 RepID=A0A378MGD2_LISGR|nr:fimbrial isopeptide formation D2 domain [Listeria grayi]
MIKDKLPEELQYIADSTKIDGKSVSDQTAVWQDQELTTEFPELQAGEKRVITFQVKVTKKPVNNKIRNQAQATGEDAEGKETPPVKTETEIPASNSPDGIRIEKQVADEAGKDMDKKEVQTGDKVYYSILVTNQIADSVQQHIRINDMIPKGLRAEPETLTVTQEKKLLIIPEGFKMATSQST